MCLPPFRTKATRSRSFGDALPGEQMQSIAAWTNLSDTTFVCTPTNQRADYRLRIFTPRRVAAVRGPPTIGSAHAVLRRGFKPRTASAFSPRAWAQISKYARSHQPTAFLRIRCAAAVMGVWQHSFARTAF